MDLLGIMINPLTVEIRISMFPVFLIVIYYIELPPLPETE